MLDTIELLEAIGENANLRHASGETLAETLSDASEPLKQAIRQGDRSALAGEFGSHVMQVVQSNQDVPDDDGEQPAREDESAPASRHASSPGSAQA